MTVPFFPEFEDLHHRKRIKFIEICGEIFVYNARDSLLIKVDSLPDHHKPEVVKTPNPPLKTLILHTTYECNFGCKHCYLQAGQSRPDEMDSKELSRVVREFGELGGLGVDISGGEALLKRDIREVISTARDQRLRTVILSNAGYIDQEQLKEIVPLIDCIAIGLDGLHEVNDKIRGNGTFNRIVRTLEMIANEGVELSFTTLITVESVVQLREFPRFIQKYGGRSWSLVMPRPSGRFSTNLESIKEAYAAWDRAKKDGILLDLYQETKSRNIAVILDHILVPGSKKRVEQTAHDFIYETYNKGRACWDNTLTIMPNGDVKCCLFFDGQVYANVKNKPLIAVYESKNRQRALDEFKKFPVEQCPFLEKEKLANFERTLQS